MNFFDSLFTGIIRKSKNLIFDFKNFLSDLFTPAICWTDYCDEEEEVDFY